jgi:DNA-binding MurR/RpiR family transcriptional regulator
MASPTFDARIAAHFQRMSPAERRASRGSFGKIESRSSAALASKEETSDATIVRATKALGFAGRDDLRRALADELRNSLSPAELLTRTLGVVGSSLSAAFEMSSSRLRTRQRNGPGQWTTDANRSRWC